MGSTWDIVNLNAPSTVPRLRAYKWWGSFSFHVHPHILVMFDTGLLYDTLNVISKLRVIWDMTLHRLVNTVVLEEVSAAIFEVFVII